MAEQLVAGGQPPKPGVPWMVRNALALDDFGVLAKPVLPRMIHGYIAGSVETGAAMRAARDAYADWALVPRVLVDASGRQQRRMLLGEEFASPFGIAPLGGAAIAAYRGDLVLAAAARDARVPMVMSASSLIRLEEVREAYPRAWFQAYLAGDFARIDPMVDRVAAAGFSTLVVTADTPVPGNRENNVRTGYSMPIKVTPRVALDCALHPVWLLGTLARTFQQHGMPHFENMDAERGPPMMSRDLVRNFGARDQLAWEHIEGIRKRWPGKLVVKGLLCVDDVRRAREAGADAAWLSSHGGRQLDHAVAPLRVLPEARAAFGQYPLLIDGGVRRGTDVLKALALGADFVFVGRPMVFAAALAGARGVGHALGLLRDEVDRNMAMLGVRRLEEMTGERVVRA